MDRLIVYPGAIPLDTDILSLQRNAMLGLGYLAQATLGSSTVVDGLACTATSPASLAVNIGPGSILFLSTIDATAYGSLPSNATDPLVKMGINTTTTVLSLSGAVPGTSGQSRAILVEASFGETDTTPVVLPYYNATNPAVPYTGPANSGATQFTLRQQTVQLQVKLGTPATTGTQVTPSVDAGWTGLYVITLAFGASTVVTGNIAKYSGAPFIDPSAAGRGIQPGRLLASQIFTSGTATYTPTAGTNKVRVTLCGGGGASGGAPSTSTGQTSYGAPGGGGAYAQKTITASFSGVTVTVGAGGTGVSGAAGNAGGSSSFGALVAANGGSAGTVAAASATTNYTVTSGAGGTVGASGDINAAGNTPPNGQVISQQGVGMLGGIGWIPGRGVGGLSTSNTASASAVTGNAGTVGIVIVEEFS